jgi:Polyketide cyclase / dehydrase and lipid transport
MWMTNLTVERSLTVATTAERAWSLLSGPAGWSMRPGTFAFDLAPTTGDARLRLVIGAGQGQVAAQLFGISEEMPGRAISLRHINAPPGRQLTHTLSVRPGQRAAKLAISVTGEISRYAKLDVRAHWRKHLDVWLADAQAVLEGHKPWPGDEIPPSVRAECTRRRVVADAVSVSATVVIAAPPARVWRTVWDPATGRQVNLSVLAAGQVPGTPVMATGEMQYEVERGPNGTSYVQLMTLHDCEADHRAVVQTVSPFESESVYLIEPEAGGTRLTVTSSVPGRIVTAAGGGAARARQAIAEHLARCKSFIEEPGHVAGQPGQ